MSRRPTKPSSSRGSSPKRSRGLSEPRRCGSPAFSTLTGELYEGGIRRSLDFARTAHSSSGLGHRPLTAAARVRIPYAPYWISLRNSRPEVGSTVRDCATSALRYALVWQTPGPARELRSPLSSSPCAHRASVGCELWPGPECRASREHSTPFGATAVKSLPIRSHLR